MARRYLVLTLAAAVAASVLAAGALARRNATPTLAGTVGPGFTITFKQGTKVVRTLKAGTYKFVIQDKSAIHGWSLDGPHGFAKDIAAVSSVGTKTVTLKLQAGKYKYYCPSHESVMFGRFTVT